MCKSSGIFLGTLAMDLLLPSGWSKAKPRGQPGTPDDLRSFFFFFNERHELPPYISLLQLQSQDPKYCDNVMVPHAVEKL